MANNINDKYELIEPASPTVGDFDNVAFKARELLATSGDDHAGRIVLLRKIPIEMPAPTITEAASRAAAIGRHLSILDFYEVTQISGEGGIPQGAYLATEYVRGITLRERIRRVAPFSLSVTLDIAIAIAQASQFALEQGIGHGHLCPEEVLLTPEGHVKVADFAISQAVHDSLHSDHQVPGSDIRALGLILFEMLTGSQPAANNDLVSFSPAAANSGIPSAIDGITQKALSTDQRNKYTSMGSLLSDLQTAREELRAGKPLSWTPQEQAAQRTPPKPAPGLLTQAAGELSKEDKRGARTVAQQYSQPEPAGSGWLSKLVMILFALVVVGIITVVIIATKFLTVPSDTVVPNLVGQQFADAQKIAKSNHFNLVVQGHGYSDVWPVNTVITQSVPSGREIKSGKNVDITVSDGPPLSQVPDITQDTLAKAKQMIQMNGLPIGVVTPEFNDVIPAGIVTGQNPVANAMVSHKTPINISVSKGPSPPPAPTGLSASATVVNEIDLSWNEVTNASSYNVYRDGKKIASGVTQSTYSDMRLGTNETHSYTVTAVNVNGESTQCAAVSGTTLGDNGAPVDQTAPPPAAPATPTTGPADTNSTSPASPVGTAPRQRQFHIRFRLPSGGGQHNVQIEVQDATGANVVYDETRDAGKIIDQQVAGFGNKVIMRIYLDGKLVKQETK